MVLLSFIGYATVISDLLFMTQSVVCGIEPWLLLNHEVSDKKTQEFLTLRCCAVLDFQNNYIFSADINHSKDGGIRVVGVYLILR